jgi:predicted acylesterase/phospholipase RssA
LYNTDGLKEKVREVIAPIYHEFDTGAKVMLFASVSITTGDLIYFTNRDLRPFQPADDQFRYQKVDNIDEMVNAIMASANQPVVAELIPMRNARTHRVEQFGDGGIRDYLPIKAAINLGATEIDVIQCSPFFFEEDNAYQGILPILFRTLALITDQIGQSNIDYAKRLLDQDTSHVRRIRIFRAPHAGYGNDNAGEFPFLSNSLTFDSEKMRTMWDKGAQVFWKIRHGEIRSPADEYLEYTPAAGGSKHFDKGEIVR